MQDLDNVGRVESICMTQVFAHMLAGWDLYGTALAPRLITITVGNTGPGSSRS